MTKVELKHEIYNDEGQTIKSGGIKLQGIENPVYLNMQFCIEKEQFESLEKLCREYKLSNIHHAIQTILEEAEPEEIINLAT